jgi:hypothetical protein
MNSATNHVALSATPRPGTSLSVRSADSIHRLPQIRTDWVATQNVGTRRSAELHEVAADVAQAVRSAALQHRTNNSWLQLELDLWQAVTGTLNKWRSLAAAPAAIPGSRPHGPHASRRVVGPERFPLRHRPPR